MGKEHNHFTPGLTNEKSLTIALILTSIFLVVEVIGSFITGSLALISDAAHMLTDAAALAIALIAIWISKRPADHLRSFGYHRFEILAAVFNAVLLFLIAAYVIYEAYQRMFIPTEVQSLGMFIVASIGLIVNLISMRLLSAKKEDSLNLKGAYLEVWSDMLGSVGVIIAAIIIRYTNWMWVDSAVAIAIGLWVLPRTWILLKESINILLEGVPKELKLEDLKQAMCAVDGVIDVHELHVWGISSGKNILTAHVVIKDNSDCERILMATRQMLINKFDIHHTTLQHESSLCFDEERNCRIS